MSKVIRIRTKTKAEVPKDTSEPKVHLIENYTPKSFIVTGNTKPFMNSLKGNNGTFNRNLTDPETKEKVIGYIFSNKNLDNVKKLVEKINSGELEGEEDLEMQTISYSVVLPKVGYRVTFKEDGGDGDVSVKITEVYKDSEDRAVSFKAKGDKTYTFELVNGSWLANGKDLEMIKFRNAAV